MAASVCYWKRFAGLYDSAALMLSLVLHLLTLLILHFVFYHHSPIEVDIQYRSYQIQISSLEELELSSPRRDFEQNQDMTGQIIEKRLDFRPEPLTGPDTQIAPQKLDSIIQIDAPASMNQNKTVIELPLESERPRLELEIEPEQLPTENLTAVQLEPDQNPSPLELNPPLMIPTAADPSSPQRLEIIDIDQERVPLSTAEGIGDIRDQISGNIKFELVDGSSYNQIPQFLLGPPEFEYPAWAQQEGIQGTITLSLDIGDDGAVRNVIPVKSALSERLTRELIRQAEIWRFRPLYREGIPLAGQVLVTVDYQLLTQDEQ